jgi:hypothetical protein
MAAGIANTINQLLTKVRLGFWRRPPERKRSQGAPASANECPRASSRPSPPCRSTTTTRMSGTCASPVRLMRGAHREYGAQDGHDDVVPYPGALHGE